MRHTNDIMDNPLSMDIMKLQPTINIGTLGAVAHGKSTLVKVLSGKSTGQFQNEKEKNMTIKLGYANVKLFECQQCQGLRCVESKIESSKCDLCKIDLKLVRHFSFVDSPGHHTLVTTALSGAAVMDNVLFIIASNEKCPQPQTFEHMAASELFEITKKMIIVQNKVDLCTRDESLENYKQIRTFVKESGAKDASIIPISGQLNINIDLLCKQLLELPIPNRNIELPLRMTIIRSFDSNKPKTLIKKDNYKNLDLLLGGVVGGSISQGIAKLGQKIEIRPGLILKNGLYQPIRATITSLYSDKNKLEFAVPGGLIGIGLDIDPYLTKRDGLIGNVLGLEGTLPPVFKEGVVSYKLLNGIKTPKSGTLLFTIGSSKRIINIVKCERKKRLFYFNCELPICASINDMVAISKRIDDNWRLIGGGTIKNVTE